MQQKTFRGQVKRKTFDPLRAPDPTLRLQQNMERTLSGMRQVKEQHLRNTNEVKEARREKYVKEKEQRDDNRRIENFFDEAYHKAEMDNYQREINNIDVKLKDAQRDGDQLKKLAHLMPKILQTYAEVDQVRFEKLASEGKVLSNQFGLSGEEALAFTYQLEALRGNEAAINNLIDKFAPDATDIQRQQLRSLRGYRKVGFKAKGAQDLVNNRLEAEWMEWSKNKKNVGKSGRTAAEILGDPEDMTGAELKGLRNRFNVEFQKKHFSKENSEFVRRFITPGIDAKADQFIAQVNTATSKNRERINFEQDEEDVDSYKAVAGSTQEFVDNWFSKGGDKGHLNRTLAKVAQKKAASGEWKDTDIEDIENSTIVINGKEYRLGDHKDELWQPVRKTLHDYEYGQLKLRKEELKVKGEKAWIQYNNTVAEYGQFQSQDWANFEEHLIAQGIRADQFDTVVPWLKGEKSKEIPEVKEGKLLLDGILESPDVDLKMKHLRLVPRVLWDDYKKKTIDGEHSIIGKNDILDVLKKAIFAEANDSAKSRFEINSEAERVWTIGKQRVEQALETALIKSDIGDASTVLRNLVADEVNLIKTNAKGSIYERATKDGKIIKGAGGGYINVFDPQSVLNEYKRQTTDDVNRIERPGLVSEHDLQAAVDYSNNQGRMPNFAQVLAEGDPNRTPFEIIEAVVKAETGKRIKPKGHEVILSVVPPEYRSLITNKGSTAKLWQAVAFTPEMQDAFTTSFIYKDVYNKNPKDPYDVVGSPTSGNGLDTATNVFNANISKVPVSNLIDAQNKGMLTEVGAFKFTKNDLLGFIGTNMLDAGEYLTPELQKVLYREKTSQITSTVFADNQMFEPIPGVGQSWASAPSATKVKEDELDPVTLGALSQVIDITKIPGAIYDEFLGRTVQPLKRVLPKTRTTK